MNVRKSNKDLRKGVVYISVTPWNSMMVSTHGVVDLKNISG
jgi:hypothetical protein